MGWRTPRKPFAGKHVLITGGSAGIGLALAKEFYKQGACITLVARTEAKLAAAVAEITSMKGAAEERGGAAPRKQSVEYQVADTTIPEQVRSLLLDCQRQRSRPT